MPGRRTTLTRWLIIAIAFSSAAAGGIAGLKAIQVAWPSWVVPSVAAALGVVAASFAAWAQSEVRSAIDHRKLRQQRQIQSEQALQKELGPRRNLPKFAQVDPHRLGVHAALRSNSVTAGADAEAWDLPVYVLREVDNDLRTLLNTAKIRGGFFVLVGTSSVGKTRCAYEAVRSILGSWQVLHPKDAVSLTDIVDTGTSLGKTIVWLDEIQRYLDGERGLSPVTVRKLLDDVNPVVLIGTIWPDRYHGYLERGASPDLFERERSVLRLSTVIDVSDTLSEAERSRAKEIGKIDNRIAEALKGSDFGMTQILAAAPELVRRWDNAAIPAGKALLTAAIDARRLGAKGALPADFLENAAPAYLSSTERASSSRGWFVDALRFAKTPVNGVAAALVSADGGMGVTSGYLVADYLAQHGQIKRAKVVPPEAAWQAMVNYIESADDLRDLAKSAKDRALLKIAHDLYLKSISLGSMSARRALAEIFDWQGRSEEAEQILREGIEVGGKGFRSALAYTLQKHGKVDEEAQIRKQAVELGERFAKRQLGEFFVRIGRLEDAERILREAIADGDTTACSALAKICEDNGDLVEAERLIRISFDEESDGGKSLDASNSLALAKFLIRRGRDNEAEQLLRDAEKTALGILVRSELVKLLDGQSRHDEAEAVLRDSVSRGEPLAEFWLVSRLREKKRNDEADEILRNSFDRGAPFVGPLLAAAMIADGKVEEGEKIMMESVASGDPFASIMFEGRKGDSKEAIRKYGLNADGTVASAWW